MSADRIAVDAEVLRLHAARVDQVAADAALAADAVSGVNLSGGAFGVLCGFLVAPATLASAAGHQVVASTGHAVGRSAQQVRGWADDVERVDVAAQEAIAALRSALDAL